MGRKRVETLQRYGREWLERPPRAGVVYRVRGYAGREHAPPAWGQQRQQQQKDGSSAGEAAKKEGGADTALEGGSGEALVGRDADDEDDGEEFDSELCAPTDLDAWEIGHLTQGRYALDSWRIFCRDALLGRGPGHWHGGSGRGGRCEGEGEHQTLEQMPEQTPESASCFQPEWMRVQPLDKELRAWLRWAWMREGWDWDPETGARGVLGAKLAEAVNAGRVAWDGTTGALVVVGEGVDGGVVGGGTVFGDGVDGGGTVFGEGVGDGAAGEGGDGVNDGGGGDGADDGGGGT
jgi:hypothetical protein